MKHFPLSKNFSISFHKWRQWYQKGLDITLLFHLEYLQNSETWGWQLYCNWSLCSCCLEFLSLSDTFEEHVMLRHQETDHGNCSSKEHPSHRCRIMSNVSYAPLEYVNNHGVLKSLFVFLSPLYYIFLGSPFCPLNAAKTLILIPEIQLAVRLTTFSHFSTAITTHMSICLNFRYRHLSLIIFIHLLKQALNRYSKFVPSENWYLYSTCCYRQRIIILSQVCKQTVAKV